MKDGLVARKGTLREIGKRDPSLLASWNLEIQAQSVSEIGSGSASSAEEERAVLRKQISKTKKLSSK